MTRKSYVAFSIASCTLALMLPAGVASRRPGLIRTESRRLLRKSRTAEDERIGEGCGHFLPEECPNELAAAILDFWRETR